MRAKRATTVACGLLGLVALADLTVVLAVLVSPHVRHRTAGASLFIVLSAFTALLAWRLWRRSRWAYRVSLAVSAFFLLSSTAAFSQHGESLAGLAASLVLVVALVAAYPEFRVPSKPLYLTPTQR